MAVTSLEVPFRADVVHRRRRWHWPRWALPLVIGLLIAGVLSGAAARITYAATYQPPIVVTGGGPVTAGFTFVRDGFGVSRLLLTAKPGTTSTFRYSMTNDGSVPVTIDHVVGSPSEGVETSWRWTTSIYSGEPDRALPVVVAPQQTVDLLFSIRKPVCPGPGGSVEINQLALDTRAFGFSHTTNAWSDAKLEPIEVCWPQ